MDCRIFDVNFLKQYKYVVVLSHYKDKILLSRHKQRSTWETQGGHIENGESPIDAAKRELYEESGAVDFIITPLCDYWAGNDNSGANGMVFLSDIKELGDIPQSEMQEVRMFDVLPSNLTYPDITPKLFNYAKAYWENPRAIYNRNIKTMDNMNFLVKNIDPSHLS